MTHLRIELNTTPEIVTSNTITKLYNIAKEIIDYEELNDVEESLIYLKGNLLVNKAYDKEVDYLENKFLGLLSINVTGGKYIKFDDPAVYERMSLYLGDGIGIMLNEITNNNWYSNTTDPKTNALLFTNNTDIVSFNELGRFPLITSIPANCFNGCTSLQSIDLSNIDTLRETTFKGCSSLTSIDTSNITTLTGSYIFNLTSITSINLSSFSGAIPNNCFENCSNLQTVINNGNITEVGVWSFYGCSSLTSINLSNCVTIKSSGFNNCSSLTTIDLSNTTRIEDGAFNGCSNLTTIGSLANIEYLGLSAFTNCSNITGAIDLSSLVTVLNGSQFLGCSKITSVTSYGVSEVKGNMFNGCSLLSSFDFSNITIIGGAAFKQCALSGKLYLPLCTRIDSEGFLYNTGLTEIEAPELIRADYQNQFSNCPNITKINFLKYEGGINCLSFKDVLQEYISPKCTTLVGGQFLNCVNLSNLLLDFEHITKLPAWSLNNCRSLTGIFDFASLTEISTQALQGDTFDIILRNSSVVSLTGYDNFGGGTSKYQGNVYVPDNLVATYQSTTGWQDLGNLIKPISQLPQS